MTWVAIENIGLARFVPAPASDLTSELQVDDWPTEGGSSLRANAAPGPLTALTGEVAWTADLGAPLTGGPVVMEGSVYAGDTNGCVHAFAVSDGAPLWNRCLGTPISSTPSVAGHLIYVGLLDGQLTALNRGNGSIVWIFQTGGPVRSSPAVVDGVLFTGSSDHRLYALDALDGKERWSFATAGRITYSPAVNEHLVIVVSQDNLIHFIDKRTAKRWFDYRIRLASGSAAVADDSIYATDAQGTIRRVHWENHEWPLEKAIRNVRQWMFRWGMLNELPPAKGVVWVRQETGESFSEAPAIDSNRVYVSTVGGRVFAYDRQTGDKVWRADLHESSATAPVVHGGQVVIGTSTGLLVALEAATGRLQWRIKPGADAIRGIAVGGEALYATDANGMLIGIR